MSFFPRLTFPLPSRTPSWFAGHMARSLKALPALLKDIDLVIEARDARLPLTSINTAFDEALKTVWGGEEQRGLTGKRKLVVYTKRDLGEGRLEQPIRDALLQHAQQPVIFADTRVDRDVKAVLKFAVDTAKANGDAFGDMKVLVVGMPNVGKSSLLNALRRVGVHKGKAFRIGAEPGITRKLTGTVKIFEEPSIYVYDTPGVMVPYLGKGVEGAEKGLKLALTAGIKASLFEPDVIADYLLYRLNIRHVETEGKESYITQLPLPTDFTTPTNSLPELLSALARRLGALRSGGEEDVDAAMTFLLRAFREGKFGRWTLDDLEGGERVTEVVSPEVLVEATATENTSEPPPRLKILETTHHPRIATSPTDLQGLVSSSVLTFIHAREAEALLRADGVPESITQEKKMEKAKALEVRKEKMKARGARVEGVNGPGYKPGGGAKNARKSKGRGRK